jgi:transcriptional regulator with XRE-family HTH domain
MAKSEHPKPTKDAVEILDRHYFKGKPEMQMLFEQERVNADVAQKAYDLRTAAGLTQRELADQVGTTASVICRLEDADYAGHSLTMLQRIAAALGKRMEVYFVATTEARSSAKRKKKKAGGDTGIVSHMWLRLLRAEAAGDPRAAGTRQPICERAVPGTCTAPRGCPGSCSGPSSNSAASGRCLDPRPRFARARYRLRTRGRGR